MKSWSLQIEEDLKWREAELASLKVLVQDASDGSVRKTTLLRALWAMLYAHYEGFCKFAWDLYLDSLAELDVPRKDCCTGIATLSLRKEFKLLRGDLSPSALWDFYEKQLPDLLNQRLSFATKLETESNLWPDLLQENSSQAGLPCLLAEANHTKLKALVGRRNDIAHGQRMVIRDLAEYMEYELAALLSMHELAVGVLEALESKSYLK